MNMELQEKKKHSWKRFVRSFHNSFAGLKYAYRYEQSMTIHMLSCITIFILGILFHISEIEWAICIMVLGLIGATELINTSIEAVVDLVTQEIHPLAKIAKDTASAAVFVFSTVAFICFLIIFIPKIILIG
mgnify:CR=1 FL=1